ncbi:MAG: DUF2442 domain-containing protein [Candidatus Latescibacteria bacterium]|nr:DUF2442 domain-containing protein [Candidatus Latescibacterota bacterium]
MSTSASNIAEHVSATEVRFEGNILYVTLSDSRQISVPLENVPWLKWLNSATPEQRARWSLEPGGLAIYWGELDDGLEISHLLSMQPLI